MRLLITGGAGFIGSHLADLLGFRARVPLPEGLRPSVEWFREGGRES